MIIAIATERELEVLKFALSLALDHYYTEKKGYGGDLLALLQELQKLEVNA